MQEFNPSNEIPRYESVLPTSAEAVEELHILLPTATTATYPISLNIPFGGLISGLVIKSTSGTGTVTVAIDGVSVVGLSAKTFSSVEASYLSTSANAFFVGQDITIQFTAVSSPVNVSINLQIIRSLPSATSTTVVTASGNTLDGTKEENIVYPLSIGVVQYTIPFAVVKTDVNSNPTSSYSIFSENTIENITDSISLTISARVVARSSSGLTILLTGIPDTANYVYRANVKVI